MTAKSNNFIPIYIMPNTYAVSRPNAENETCRIRGSVIAAEPKPKRLKMTSRRANEFSHYILYSKMYTYIYDETSLSSSHRQRRPRRPYTHAYIYIYICIIRRLAKCV